MAVHFFFNEASVTLNHRSKLKKFIESIFKRERKRLNGIDYIFCSDEYLLGINRQFLNHDYYTDIITFDISDPGQPTDAEIYISVDRVRDNAISLNQTLNSELHRVMFHGALHLCGYMDKTKRDQSRMRAIEAKYLDLYFNSNAPRGTL
ncbi:MAG: rRNA maturation RNase YbeY [Chitinophagaceae bacterium]|nr:rRNA maturation RNase YbeY [Chitinophagaceae bacterium]